MSDTLKPCPFCGPGRSVVSAYQDEHDHWSVGCGACGSHSGVRPPSDPNAREKVIESWNSRPCEAYAEDQVRAVVAVAHEHGWNGVENSKILHVFLENELTWRRLRIAALTAIIRDARKEQDEAKRELQQLRDACAFVRHMFRHDNRTETGWLVLTADIERAIPLLDTALAPIRAEAD
jgi:Lar family restriction alleviation protein